jgi:hypothetical protein
VTATSSPLREGNHLREGEMNSRFRRADPLDLNDILCLDQELSKVCENAPVPQVLGTGAFF